MKATPSPLSSSSSTTGEEEEALTRDALVAYVRSGCKPRTQWRIGTEHEKFGFYRSSKAPLTYETIAYLLRALESNYEWSPIMEGENIIGLRQGGQSVTLEPGGQFELSGAPLETIHLTCAEVNSHLYQVSSIAEEIGVGFLGVGFQPKWRREDIHVMPKGRYDIMRRYMPTRGSLGLDMMLRTCTIQVNLDFESEEDMIQKMRVGLALQPVATALFANSPFKEARSSDFLSLRSQVWTDTDPDRTGDLPFVFDDDFGFETYVDYVLRVPMYFVYRGGTYVDVAGESFLDFLEGKLPQLPGERPTLQDWEDHMTTVFPEVRMKRFIEMRGADGGPWRRICALSALWVGLLYDERAQQDAYALIADWTQEERGYLRMEAAHTGLRTPFRDGTLLDVAREVLRISREGLERRGHGEMKFLASLESIVETGVTPAEELLLKFNGEWKGDIDKLFDEYCY